MKGKSKFPYTKSKGPYIFLNYDNDSRTVACIINPKNTKIKKVNITKISTVILYSIVY